MSDTDSNRRRASPPPGPSEAISRAIREAVAADLAPVRARSLGARTLIVVACAVFALVVPAIAMRVMSPTSGVDNRAAVVAALVALVGAGAIVGCFGPVGRLRLGPRGKLAALVIVHVGWLAYLLVSATAGGAEGAAGAATRNCAMGSSITGFVAGVVAIWAFRCADPWTPRRSGALVGAATGCIAAAGFGIGCQSQELGHLLAGHGLVVPLLAVLGALTGRCALRP